MNPITTYLNQRESELRSKWWNSNQRDFDIHEIVAFNHQTAKGLVEVVINDILNMKREAIQEKEAISPMGIVSISQGDNLSPSPEYHIRNLLYVKIHDIIRYAEHNEISILASLPTIQD